MNVMIVSVDVIAWWLVLDTGTHGAGDPVLTSSCFRSPETQMASRNMPCRLPVCLPHLSGVRLNTKKHRLPVIYIHQHLHTQVRYNHLAMNRNCTSMVKTALQS